MRGTLPAFLGLVLVTSLSCRARTPDGASAPCAEGMVLVAPPGDAREKSPAPFCIDRYEASLVETMPDGDRPFSSFEPLKHRRVRAVSRAGVAPRGYISEQEANAACKASGKRLCREDEWIAACQGPRRARFPYGNERQRGACNDEGKSPLLRRYAAAGKHAFDDDPMNDPVLNQMPHTLAPSGSFVQCTNDYGVFDMVGNLHEWVDDPAGTFRGGYYLDTKLNGDGCAYRTTAHDAAYKDYSTGFRCCADRRP